MGECYQCARRNASPTPRHGSGIPLCAFCHRDADAWAEYWRGVELERAIAAARRKGLVA